jgi:hypothetical protein
MDGVALLPETEGRGGSGNFIGLWDFSLVP